MTPTLPSTSHGNDEQHQRAVLVHLLVHHPALLTDAEIRRALADDESFAAVDAVDRALDDLRAAGVLRRVHEFVVLTRTATRTAELLEQS